MEPYQLTLKEYIATFKGKRIEHYYYNRYGQIRAWHRDAIAIALQLGHPIPEKVLGEFKSEYPSLSYQFCK